MNPENSMVDFNGVITNGACRIARKDDTLEITPLPGSEPFGLRVNLSRLPFEINMPKHLECEDEEGNVRKMPLQMEGEHIVISCEPDAFLYRLKAEDDI